MSGKNQKWIHTVMDALKPEKRKLGKPLVELWGQNRVLIENHNRVLDYQPNRIRIKVSYGEVCISGSGLLFAKLSAEQLVITGIIESVVLSRG